jgi:pimeloyl-ACP methyl ester carboxylesterase
MALRPEREAGLRLAVSLSGAAVLGLLGIRPLAEVGAEAIVRAPNYRRAVPPAQPGELRVAVGPPASALSLAIVDAAAPRGTVFVLHGVRDSKASMRGWGRMLADAGYRAVLVDLRGHGASAGDFLTYGVVDSTDLVQALDALQRRGLVAGEVGVMGHSYGAATALGWAGRDARVRTVVAVAPFASLRDVVPGYLPVPVPSAVVHRAIDLAGLRGGFDPDAASSVAAIARSRAAVLLVHGTRDARIPPWHSERILAAGRGHAELVLVDGEGHDSVTGARKTHLAERAAAWFAANLR